MPQPALVASAPNIEGNIGSCTTHVAKVVSARLSFWKEEVTQIATNSCTGEVTKYTYRGIALFPGFMAGMAIIFIVVAAWLALTAWMDSY